MFSHLPPRQRVFIRTALSAAWVTAAMGATANLILPPPTVLDLLGAVRTISSSVLIVTAVLAALGVATNRYRVEWVSAWFSAAALAPYALVYWYSVFAVDLTRMSAAFLLTSLLGFFVTRAIMCAAHAERLRLLHEEEVKDDE